LLTTAEAIAEALTQMKTILRHEPQFKVSRAEPCHQGESRQSWSGGQPRLWDMAFELGAVVVAAALEWVAGQLLTKAQAKLGQRRVQV